MTLKSLTSRTAIALVAASLGLGAVAPAFAQDAPPAPAAQERSAPDRTFRPGGPGHAGAANGLLGFERGAEGIEIAIVRLSHRLDLTEAQQALLETLKADALAAATTFESATKGLRPQRPGEAEGQAPTDPASRLDNTIALQKARLAALEAVQPAFTAFVESLDAEQQAQLMPQPGERPGHWAGKRHDRFGPQDGQRHGGPGPVDAPPAPESE
ncbi:Spy/CpxP family protein refolding chaperone [Devosia chinhatensis]|uniref:LTXXQ motif family protein n=1 Tax=Devosia chinhatensis TaxID=429727 RepID=A0A0F5FMS6_9HYPH|nr:Spy/CpxP family protein refolding chaperone [Devosia chinhatensis]KKB10141.1 hypothetical protein VE26_10255 [Devosia chinhatensis]